MGWNVSFQGQKFHAQQGFIGGSSIPEIPWLSKSSLTGGSTNHPTSGRNCAGPWFLGWFEHISPISPPKDWSLGMVYGNDRWGFSRVWSEEAGKGPGWPREATIPCDSGVFAASHKASRCRVKVAAKNGNGLAQKWVCTNLIQFVDILMGRWW